MEKNVTYSVLIVDDHSLFRDGLRRLLEMTRHTTVIGEASNGVEFLHAIESEIPDVVLMDIDMPEMNGMEASAKALLKYPELKIIALSMHGEEEYYFKMLEIGIKGFLLKSSDIDEVVEAIQKVAQGGSFFSQELMQNLISNFRHSTSLRQSPETGEDEQLSERERDVLLLICCGMSNQEIAEKLFISKRTVDKHRANILAKTNCKNTANLVVYAIKNSLVEI